MHRFNPVYLLLIFCLFSVSVFGQTKEPKIKYGKVSDEEMAMSSYPKDPSAPAVILFDKGTVKHRYVDNQGFILEFEHHKRIKIFKKEAYGFADVVIQYFKGQKIVDLKSTTYNLENGKIVETKLGDDNVFDEKLTNEVFVKKVAVPAVREGSIVELKFTVQDAGVGLPVEKWVFQHPYAPTIWSEFESSIPSFISYKKLAQGWTPFSVAEEDTKDERLHLSYFDRVDQDKVTTSVARSVDVQYATNVMHFIQENVPALHPEPLVASVHDYLSQISFDVQTVYNTEISSLGTSYQLVNRSSKPYNRTWEGIGKSLLEDYFDDLLGSGKFTATDAAKCVEGKSSNAEKVMAIYDFIGKNYQTVDLDRLWKTQTFDNLTANKKGTPTDLNILFINMLRRAKIKAYPVLASTWDNGRPLTFHVSTDEFNRVLTAVALDDSTLTVMDASAWPAPIGLLPAEDMTEEALLLRSKDDIAWIPLKSKISDRNAVVGDFTVQPDGSISGKISFSETGHDALSDRKLLKTKDELTFEQERFKNLTADGKLTNFMLEPNADVSSPVLKCSFDIASTSFGSASGNKIYLNPMLGFGLKETPFKNPDRKFGIDFGPPLTQNFIFSFHLPDGYTLEEAPKSAKMTMGENSLAFDYLVDKTDPRNIKISVKRNAKVSYMPIEEFADLQQFYSTMVAKMAEQIVLTR